MLAIVNAEFVLILLLILVKMFSAVAPASFASNRLVRRLTAHSGVGRYSQRHFVHGDPTQLFQVGRGLPSHLHV